MTHELTVVCVTTANPHGTFSIETQHSKHTGSTPVMLLSADCTGQQLGLSKCSHFPSNEGVNKPSLLVMWLGWFVANPAGFFTLN